MQLQNKQNKTKHVSFQLYTYVRHKNKKNKPHKDINIFKFQIQTIKIIYIERSTNNEQCKSNHRKNITLYVKKKNHGEKKTIGINEGQFLYFNKFIFFYFSHI